MYEHLIHQKTYFKEMYKRQLSIGLFLIGILSNFSSVIFAQQKISLAGTWELKLDPQDKGLREHWWAVPYSDKVRLPGSLTENGKGDDITLQTPWTGDVIDSSYYFSEKYAKYRQNDIKIPFWLKSTKYFAAPAWYKKTINIPENWAKKRVILNLERCHWETSVFVNGAFCGTQNSLVTAHQYDITGLLKEKNNEIVVRVDNRIKIYIGPNSSSITEHTQTNWNGIVGDISLEARALTNIEDIQIFPHLSSSSLKISLGLNQIRKQSFKGKVIYQVQSQQGNKTLLPIQEEPVSFSTEKTNFSTTYHISNPALWDEFSPNLYQLKTQLVDENGTLVSENVSTFGMREISTVGSRITINGRPIFLRGDVDCAGFPLTGYPSTERTYWNKIFTTIKSYGLNHLRFHSWCPPEIAFQVADSLGVYLYVESPLWANQGSAVGTGGLVDDFIYKESERILKNYGNHPSFCMMSYGNEPAGINQNEFLGKWVEHFKQKDTRRIYTSGAGWPILPENQFNISPDARIQRWGEELNSVLNKEKPNTTYDWRLITEKTANQPYISHEIGQWCAYPNFKEISKYTGVLKATNFEIFKETLEAKGMGNQAEDFLYSSGRLQTLCYKADIEAALRTPGFGGFQLLGLHDFPGQGTALVGALDAFWESKGYTSPEEYRSFCNTTVLLARFPSLIYTNQENMEVTLEIAHFGAKALKNAKIIWQIVDESGRVQRKGFFIKEQVNIDNVQMVGNLKESLSAFTKAQKLVLKVSLEGTDFKNSWDLWVYPSKLAMESATGNVVIAESLNPAIIQQLEAGKTVLLLPYSHVKKGKGAEVKVGFSSIFWNTAWTSGQGPHTLGITCNPQNPIFNFFPTESFSNYQWHDIMSHSQAMILDEFPTSLKASIQPIDTWFENRRLSLAFEAKVGKGKLMVCSIDLTNNIDQRPATRQLKYSLLKYLNSKAFNPTQQMEIVALQGLFENSK